MFKNEHQQVSVRKFLNELKSSGIKKSDPRVKNVIENLYAASKEQGRIGIDELVLDEPQFMKVIKNSVPIISQALQNDFVIPDFKEFTKYLEDIYYKTKTNTSGQQADYIPQLAKVDPGR